jgi:hypothetical protein
MAILYDYPTTGFMKWRNHDATPAGKKENRYQNSN